MLVHPQVPSPFPTLTILIDHQEAYQFMLRCGGKATLGSIIAALEKTYHAALGGRAVFRDRQCRKEADQKQQVQQTSSFFMGLTLDEYENAIKDLFIPKPNLPQSPPKQQTTTTQKEATNTAQTSINQSEMKKEVSSFQALPKQHNMDEKIESKPMETERISALNQPQLQYYKPVEVQYQKAPKVNPDTVDNTHQFLQTTDSLVKPQPVATGSCCALI